LENGFGSAADVWGAEVPKTETGAAEEVENALLKGGVAVGCVAGA